MTTETTQTDHQEREQFESWFLQNNPSWEITPQERRTGTYIFERANIQWQAWQAVLQSPEIQALRKDAERYRAIRDVFYVKGSRAFYEIEIGATPAHDTEEAIRRLFDDAIDAAMEKQP